MNHEPNEDRTRREQSRTVKERRSGPQPSLREKLVESLGGSDDCKRSIANITANVNKVKKEGEFR